MAAHRPLANHPGDGDGNSPRKRFPLDFRFFNPNTKKFERKEDKGKAVAAISKPAENVIDAASSSITQLQAAVSSLIETIEIPDHSRLSKLLLRPTQDNLASYMSARNRPRSGGVKDEADAHEEINMWNQIKKDLEKLSGIQQRMKELKDLIVAKEVETKELENAKKVTQKDLNELEELYREMLKLSAEENRMLKEEPTDLIRNVEILKALSEATRKAPSPPPTQQSSSRSAAAAQKKGNKPKPSSSKPSDMLDGAADSPAPTPIVQIPTSRGKGSSVRSGSVASSARERDRDSKGEAPTIIKTEDGVDGAKGSTAERAGKFFVGAEVAYKQAKPKEDGGQWIQCTIISVTDVGNKKRYEVQDPEPDENGAPGSIYKASAQALIAIPTPDTALPDYQVGKFVLARYPETTTFYRAEVMGLSKDTYRLKFEDDQNQELEVDRRYVLDFGNR